MPVRFLAFLLSLLAILAHTPARADPLEDWIAIADRGPDGRPLPPPLQGRDERTAPPLVALAMFEAANAVDHRYVSYLGFAQPGAGASIDAAMVSAAHHVLLGIYPARRAALDTAMALSLAAVPEGEARVRGIALGDAAGEAALKRSLFEGPEAEAYRPAGEIGRFVPPVLPAFEPWFMRGQPFFLKSWAEVMSPPPPPISSARYARDFDEVRLLGGVGQKNATDQSLRFALFMAQFSVDPMIRRATQKMPRLVDRARLWALVRMAALDANEAVAQMKMHYMAWRPLSAIRNADRDDNPATQRDPTWTPVMPTPNHPEYPCGHCTFSGLYAGLLEPEIGGPIEVASDSPMLPVTISFPSWQAFLEATSLARIQGGMHFRFSTEEGQALGLRVAALARARFAPPLP